MRLLPTADAVETALRKEKISYRDVATCCRRNGLDTAATAWLEIGIVVKFCDPRHRVFHHAILAVARQPVFPNVR